MSASRQAEYLQKVVGHAMIDDDFRRALKTKTDLKGAIDNKRNALGFGHNELSDQSHEVLHSLTPEEIDSLHNIFQKAKRGGIEPLKMF